MKIDFVQYHDKPEELSDLALRMLTEQLYEQRGTLSHAFDRIASTGKLANTKVALVIAWASHTRKAWAGPRFPVGVLLYEIRASAVQMYVTPAARRKGVGSLMVQCLRQQENFGNRVLEGVEGFPGYKEFAERNSIYIPRMQIGMKEIDRVATELEVCTRIGDGYQRVVKEIRKRDKREFLKQWKLKQKAK